MTKISISLLLMLITAASARAQLTFNTLAGHPGGGSSDGLQTAARFSSPVGIAADRAGNLYVADTGNHVIRKVTPYGNVTTLAGLSGVSGTQDGTNGGARFNNPAGLTLDSSGN